MNKKIFKISLILLAVFGFSISINIYAEGDTTPPTGTILINGGTLYTNTRDVTLTLSATDDISSVTEMRFNNGTGTYSDPEPYSTTKLWTLSQSANGLKTVKVKFKDQAGNENTPGISTTITLDTVIPVITLIGSSTINLNVGETYTDAGATALDDDVTDLTSSIVTVNPVDVNTAGTYTVTYDVTDPAGNSATQVIRTVIVTATPNIPIETFIIRNGDTVLFNGSVPLPASGTVSINDSDNIAHTVDARSILAILKSIDDTSNAFSISNLSYNNDYESFLLNCITPANSNPACYNWQYVVNNSYPDIGMDKNILSEEKTIYLYFGNHYKLDLDKNSIKTGESFTTTAQKYNYTDNTWSTLLNTDIAVIVLDSYPLTVITQGVTDSDGKITLTLSNTGTYNTGILIHSDFGDYLDYPPATITVTETASSGDGGGGGGGNHQPDTKTFDVQNALKYLKSAQIEDGSFIVNGIDHTDWVAIAFGAAGVTDNFRDKLLGYFNSHNTLSSTLNENSKRAMALLSLGENPYDFNGVNYIEAIINSFDGAQFGDPDLTNDDIFALIPLASVGYTANDNITVKDINFLISKQNVANGSWGSADMTAAAIQALKPFISVTGVSDALTKAKNYLETLQSSDGSWENIFSTSWAMQAMSAFNTSWINTTEGLKALSYLASQQATNGAVAPTADIWATRDAIPAALGKQWSDIMQPVSKPENKNNGNNSSSGGLSSVSNIRNPKKIDSPVIVICPPGDLFSVKTGKACTDFSLTASTNLPEIKPKIMKESTRTSLSLKNEPLAKEKTLKINNLASQNTATALMAITDSATQKTETLKRNWFLRFLDKIFSIF